MSRLFWLYRFRQDLWADTSSHAEFFAYEAAEPERKLSSIVLEVKGNLCRQLLRILKWCGREEDYIKVS